MKDTKLIFENWNKYQKTQQLDEGPWDSFKATLAKLGTMDDLISVFSKKKKMEKQAAEEYIEMLFNKKSSEFLRAFKKEMDDGEVTKGFPNNKETMGFNYGIASLETVYDSIKAAVEKDPKEKGHIPVDLANEMIQDLRDLVEFYSDKKLADVYKHFNESQVRQLAGLYTIFEQEFGKTTHTFIKWLNEDPLARFQLAQDILLEQPDAEQEFFDQGDKMSSDNLRQKAGFQDKDLSLDTKAMQGLKSGKLPLILGLLGAGFSISHLIASASGMGDPTVTQSVVKGSVTKEVLVQKTGKAAELAMSENGLIYSIGKGTTGTTAKSLGELTSQLQDLANQTTATGAGGKIDVVIKGVAEGMPNPQAGGKMLQYMAEYGAGPGANQSVWTVVNATKPSNEFIQFVAAKDPSFAKAISQGASGAGTFKGGLTNLLGLKSDKVQLAAQTVSEKLTTVVPYITVGGAAVKLSTAGAIVGSGALGTIGAGLLAASAGIALARLKGQKSSRAQKLNDLFKKLVPLKGTKENKPTVGPEIELTLDDPDVTVVSPPPLPSQDEPTPGDPDGTTVSPPLVPQDEPTPRSRLFLVRMDKDGVKFHPGTNSRSDKVKSRQRDIMKKAQDQAITGPNTDPSQSDLRNTFGTKGIEKVNLKDLPIKDLITRVLKKMRMKNRPGEPFFTVGDDIYKDMAKSFKNAGLIKTSRLTNKVKKAVEETISVLLDRVVRTNPPRKLTYKAVQPTLIKILRQQGLGKTSKNSKAIYIILRTLQDYGLIKGEIPTDPIDPPQVTERTDDGTVFPGGVDNYISELFESIINSKLIVLNSDQILKESKTKKIKFSVKK